MTGPNTRIDAHDIDRYILENRMFFLDVREPKEIEELGTLEGYHNVPLGQLEKRLGELPKDRVILTAWNGGGRAARAAALLAENGFTVAGFCGLSQYKGPRITPKAKPQ